MPRLHSLFDQLVSKRIARHVEINPLGTFSLQRCV